MADNQKTHRSSDGRGFTIIEVLIVLAIAGLILVLVFFAIGAVKRNQRNTQRKQFVGQVQTALSEYAVNHGQKFPGHPAEFCDFIESSLQKANPGMADCQPNLDQGSPCVLVNGGLYSICYHIYASPNDYVGPFDQINIQSGHTCGSNPADSANYPIKDADKDSNNLTKFTVWTPLEKAGVACAGNS